MAFPVDQTVSRLGQVNMAGDSRALFLKKFAGETLAQFRPKCLGLQLTRVRTIDSGKSASFPIIGRTAAKYHTPGQLVQADKIPHTEVVVTIDDFAISPVFIAEIDEAMNHYEVRSQYTTECADSLHELVDRNIFRMIAKTAQIVDAGTAAAAGLTILPDDDFITPYTLGNAADATDGAKLVDALYKVRTKFRKANVGGQLMAVFAPEQIEALVNASGNVANMAWLNKDVGAANGINTDAPLTIAGIKIYESNQLPGADESAGLNDVEPLADTTVGSGRAAAYRGDYSKLVGLVFTKDAIATVKLKDLAIVHKEEELRLGHTIMAKMALGHNILRHQCATAILLP